MKTVSIKNGRLISSIADSRKINMYGYFAEANQMLNL
jgi:hypothetical protein